MCYRFIHIDLWRRILFPARLLPRWGFVFISLLDIEMLHRISRTSRRSRLGNKIS